MPLIASTVGLTQPEFGYVLAVAISSALVNQWHGIVTNKHRAASKVAYPNAYASDEEASKNPAAKRFNCAQRAHANYVENLPNFLIFLTIAGLRYPVYAAVAGAVYLAGRVVYTIGYASGEPKARLRGTFAYAGILGLLVMSCMSTYKMIVGDF